MCFFHMKAEHLICGFALRNLILDKINTIQCILMHPSSLSYAGCSSLWVLLSKTLRDELRDSLPFMLRYAPINGVLCGPGRPYI